VGATGCWSQVLKSAGRRRRLAAIRTSRRGRRRVPCTSSRCPGSSRCRNKTARSRTRAATRSRGPTRRIRRNRSPRGKFRPRTGCSRRRRTDRVRLRWFLPWTRHRCQTSSPRRRPPCHRLRLPLTWHPRPSHRCTTRGVLGLRLRRIANGTAQGHFARWFVYAWRPYAFKRAVNGAVCWGGRCRRQSGHGSSARPSPSPAKAASTRSLSAGVSSWPAAR
jgi:hypothetical protein